MAGSAATMLFAQTSTTTLELMKGKYTFNYSQYQGVWCVAMSCGGENCSPDGAYDSALDSEVLIYAGRRLLQARSYWYPIMTDLHRFMIAIARVSVNHDGRGDTAPDPLVCDQGSKPKVRRLAIRVTVDLASLPGPPGFLNNSWVQVHAGHITGAGIAVWPYSVGVLVRFTSFLGGLHWPPGSVDLGHDGISFLELLILFEQWAGHRLLGEKVTGPHVRAGRPISVSSVPVSEGMEIRHVSLSAVLLGRWVSFLVGWVGSCLVKLVLTCLGCVI